MVSAMHFSICNVLVGVQAAIRVAEFRLHVDHLMAFHPLRPYRDFYGGFLLAQSAKVNVVGGEERED